MDLVGKIGGHVGVQDELLQFSGHAHDGVVVGQGDVGESPLYLLFKGIFTEIPDECRRRDDESRGNGHPETPRH